MLNDMKNIGITDSYDEWFKSRLAYFKYKVQDGSIELPFSDYYGVINLKRKFHKTKFMTNPTALVNNVPVSASTQRVFHKWSELLDYWNENDLLFDLVYFAPKPKHFDYIGNTYEVVGEIKWLDEPIFEESGYWKITYAKLNKGEK